MADHYIFPFGSPVMPLKQNGTDPKKVFVLGVYASAVHARWKDAAGKQMVRALAIASEPEIFWRGENATEIIQAVKIPSELGSLEVPNAGMNGPSGQTLDDCFLKPLGFTRNDAWLCDILPESRVNPSQKQARDEVYNPIARKYNLPIANVPVFKETELRNKKRTEEILEELEMSKASLIITLGDLPIKYFLKQAASLKENTLSDFKTSDHSYGLPLEVAINSNKYQVYPLCHPRQAGKLGFHSKYWYDLHSNWVNDQASQKT